MTEILRITPRETWEQALAAGEFCSEDLAAEGFIHCMIIEQLPHVYGKYYQGRTGLVALRINPEKLAAPLVWENPHPTWKLFPHVYGPINLDAVIDVVPLDILLAESGDL